MRRTIPLAAGKTATGKISTSVKKAPLFNERTKCKWIKNGVRLVNSFCGIRHIFYIYGISFREFGILFGLKGASPAIASR